MTKHSNKEFLHALAYGNTGLSLQKRLCGLRMVIDGLEGDPDFIAMMRHYQQSSVTETPALFTELDQHVPATSDAIAALQKMLEAPPQRPHLADAQQADAKLADVVHDLELVYDKANELYCVTFPEAARHEPRFSMQGSLSLGVQAARHGTVFETGLEREGYLSESELAKLTKMIEPDSHVAVSAGLAPTTRIVRTNDTSPLLEARNLFLTYQALIASPEYEKMMEHEAAQHMNSGAISEDDKKFHNANSVLLQHASRALLPYVVDENMQVLEGIKPQQLDETALDAVAVFKEKLPEYIKFLNNLHSKVYPDHTGTPPFSMALMQQTALGTETLRLQTHTSGRGLLPK